MKGIIAEIHNSHMIVITKNGDFIKCKKLPNCSIGEEVNIPKASMTVLYKRLTTLAASFIILAMLSTGVYAYYTPYSYISVDINPSLELYVNRFDKVIGVHAFNDDAKQVIDASKGIKNKNVNDALKDILDSAADKGYLKQDTPNSVMIVVSSSNKKEAAALSNEVSKTSAEVLSNINSDYEVILEKTKVENHKKAIQENISPGKIILASKFKEVKPEIDEEKIKRMPLQQAIKEIEKKDDNHDDHDVIQMTAVEKPKQKPEVKGNVVNVKELIKEKNEELGKKLQEKEDNKNKDDDDKEGFNQNNSQKDNNKDNNGKGKGNGNGNSNGKDNNGNKVKNNDDDDDDHKDNKQNQSNKDDNKQKQNNKEDKKK